MRNSVVYPPISTTSQAKRRSTTTDLPFGYRSNPDKGEIKYDDYYTHDPERARIVRAIVAEDDGKDDAAEIARSAYKAG